MGDADRHTQASTITPLANPIHTNEMLDENAVIQFLAIFIMN